MVKIEYLLSKKRITKLSELESERYYNFFENSYKENLELSKFIMERFSRWSIIVGYYAMHDITKLLIAKKLRLKIEYNVHKLTINLLKEIIKDKQLISLIKQGYYEFLQLANDLKEAKKERTKAQYYTGTNLMREEYSKRAKNFYDEIVLSYIEKINFLLKN